MRDAGMVESSIAQVTPSWQVAKFQQRKAGKPIRFDVSKPRRNPDDIFWAPTKPIDVYCVEQTAFRSLDRWARTKLLESREQAQGQLDSVTTRHAVDILLRITRRKLESAIDTKNARTLIVHLIHAIFNPPHDTPLTNGNYVRTNCFYQEYLTLKQREMIELMKVPEIEQFMAKEEKDLNGCRNALVTSSRNWQLTIKGIIFKRWKTGLFASNVAAKRFREFIKKMLDPNLKPILVGWRNILLSDAEYQMRKQIKEIVRKHKYGKQQLSILNSKQKMAETKMAMYKSQIAGLLLEQQKHDTILADPARAPQQLKWVIDSLSTGVAVLSTYLSTEHAYKVKEDVSKVDIDVTCMDAIMPVPGSDAEAEFLEKCEQAESLELCDDDDDMCFPFEMVSGMKLTHWVSHVIDDYFDAHHLEKDGVQKPKQIVSGEDLQDGMTFSFLAQHLLPVQWEQQLVVENQRAGNALLQAIKSSDSAHDPADRLCRLALKCFQSLAPPIGKFIKVHEMTGKTDVVEELKDIAKLGDDTVQHRMVTMYLGQTIELEDNSEQLQFNLLINILQMIGGVKAETRKVERMAVNLAAIEEHYKMNECLQGLIKRPRFHLEVNEDGDKLISDEEKREEAKLKEEEDAEIAKAYSIFLHKATPRIKQNHPEMSIGEVAEYIQGMWKELPDHVRQQLRKDARNTKEGQVDVDSEDEGGDEDPLDIVDYEKMPAKHIKQLLDTHGESLVAAFVDTQHIALETFHEREKWRHFRNDIVRIGWRSMCHTLLAQRVAIEEHIDDGLFTKVSRAQLADVFETVGEDSVEAQDQAIADIREELTEHLAMLQQIFTFYCTGASSGSNESMDRGEFWKFIRDIKVKHKTKLTSPDLDLIFTAANVDRDENDDDDRDEHSAELLPIEFSECLVRIAVARFDQGPTIMRLRALFENHVLKYACSTNKNVFKRRIETDEVFSTFEEFRKPLRIVYQAYARADQQDDAINKKDSINYNELLMFCRGMGILKGGSNVSEVAVSKIFALVQGNTETSFLDVTSPKSSPAKERKALTEEERAEALAAQREFTGSPEEMSAATMIQASWRGKKSKQDVASFKKKKKEDEQSELSWPEFLEVLSALSCYVMADPYLTMQKKIRSFIVERVIIPASNLEKGGLFDDKALRLIKSYVPRAESPIDMGTGNSPKKMRGSDSPKKKSLKQQ